MKGVIFFFWVLAATGGAASADDPSVLAMPQPAPPRPNPHWVGAFNTVMPGGGQFLLGNYRRAFTQLAITGATFGVGYSMSRLSPMTLDGVPEDLPIRSSKSVFLTTTSKPCILWNSTYTKCLVKQTVTRTTRRNQSDEDEHDFTEPIVAAMLQEFAIKYHMVNVFESYREASTVDGKVQDSWIDPRPTGDLFLDPFRKENLTDPWVWIPLTAVIAATIVDYNAQISGGLTPLSKMDVLSNALFSFNYLALQPIGSGAPEEMFYRGYLQTELYHLVQSPFFSIPLSTAAFAFSHGATGRPGSAVSGAYLGTLAHINHGRLGPGIALHFWSVVVLGIETVALTLRSQEDVPPIGAQLQFMF